MIHTRYKYTFLITINLLIPAIHAAEKTIVLNSSPYDMSARITTLLRSSRVQTQLRHPGEPKNCLTILEFLQEDPSLFNKTNNKRFRDQSSLFKIMSRIIEEKIDWDFANVVHLTPKRLELETHSAKKPVHVEVLQQEQAKYAALFEERLRTLPVEIMDEVYGQAVLSACKELQITLTAPSVRPQLTEQTTPKTPLTKEQALEAVTRLREKIKASKHARKP